MDQRNQHSEVTPHADGKKESIINDALATTGSQVGINLNAYPEYTQEKKPYDHEIKPDPAMAAFEHIMRGKKMEE